MIAEESVDSNERYGRHVDEGVGRRGVSKWDLKVTNILAS